MPLEGPTLILGLGNVGSSFLRALGASESTVGLSARAFLEGASDLDFKPSVVVIAARDSELSRVAERLALLGWIVPCVHTSGVLGVEPLKPLALKGWPTGVMHPLVSFIPGLAPTLAEKYCVVRGAPLAVSAAARLAERMAMRVARPALLDPVLYHGAACLAAGGLVSLLASAVDAAKSSGFPPSEAESAILGLALSVLENAGVRGLSEALSGPIRRGAPDVIERHLAALTAQLPESAEIYRALVPGQVRLSQALGTDPVSLELILRRTGSASRL